MVSQKTNSIADGLFCANKWFSKRPPLLPLVFFKPINGHLEDHRSRVGEHPAAASGGTGPPSENTSRPFPQAPWGVPLGQTQSGPCGTYRGPLRGRWDVPAFAAYRHVRYGRYGGESAAVRAAAIIL